MRVNAERVYGIPPEQVIGSTGATRYGDDSTGRPFLTKEPRLLLNDNDAGKPEGIQLMQESSSSGGGPRLVLHDDARRE